MRSDSSHGRHMTAALTGKVEDDRTAAQVAAVCAATWLEVEAALTPIIGRRGVAARGQRSLHLASAQYPWLNARQPGGPDMLDQDLLVALLAPRRSDEAAAAASAFLQTFRELLSNLIGTSLSERLLHNAWGPPDSALNCAPAQNPTP